ncbi:MAG TPA: ATPase, T2SS/T4P/T4SS family, partial [Gemmatimonadaceae bacterium]|nr:ATPase, T2SS/T4P/T4SS family [Gemmatimonadaceae bacterium]
SRASDIHLEPEDDGVAVRYRIDGVLRQTMKLPRPAGIPLVSRVKIMAQLDIADRLRPQDGRARVSVNGSPVDLRVSTLPASHGEKVVIRILDAAQRELAFDALGLLPEDEARIRQLVELREGIVLVTGPTGSGKTTTLYTALKAIQQRGVNIVTVEDPVEIRLPQIVQVQVNEKAGLTFAAALRSILRQDPDVVLVGEIRDRETASIAVQASLTGHLVLSTLHTIDAASSVARLVDIGVESYKIAAALKGIVAQRLLRRLCPACRRDASGEVPPRLRHWFPEGVPVYAAVGCPECGSTGFRGRAAVAETLIVDAELERLVGSGEGVDQVTQAARRGGMRTLWESGVAQVLAGVTSVDEVLRVLEVPVEARGGRVAQRAPATERGSSRVARPAVAPLPSPPVSGSPSDLIEGAFELVDDPVAPAESEGEARVLLVENEAPLRGVLRDLLEREGFEVLEAGDGVEAISALDRGNPDVLVLDLTLPRLDGYAVLGRLRARRETAQLPVLVLTAREDEEAEVRVFELGADDFLSKPFRARALVARLRAVLRRSGVARDGGQ